MVQRWMVAGVCALALAVGVAASSRTVTAQASEQGAEARAALVNLNTATTSDLEKLPGIGPATAQRIVEYRQKNGGFKKIEELMNVRGIGEASFLKLKAQISVAPARTTER